MKAPDLRTLVRINHLLLILSSVFVATTIVSTAVALRLWSAPARLEDLSRDQRITLAERMQRLAPHVYQPFPVSGPTLFYRMTPGTRYDNVLGSSFTTNELGFRAIPTTPKRPGVTRILVVGDSWTFGSYVDKDDTFTHQLEVLLTREQPLWEAYNLAMPGWNTQNELAALRVFLSRLQPDIVVICPTSNDIDDSYGIWEGNLVDQGFMSGAVFRHSYEYRRRWIEAFRQLQEEVGFLQRQRIPTLIYFLAEWRKLAPYYADLAGFRATYTVVPTDLILGRYRLAAEIDPGQHASPEGHKLIASYLYNALIESHLVKGRTPIPSEYPVTLPGRQYAAKEVEAELKYWWPSAQRPDLIQLADGFMANDGLFSVSAAPEADKVVVTLHLVDEPALYPLTVTVEVASDEKVRRQVVFDHYVPDAEPVTLAKPRSLDTYPIVEVRVHANRIASVGGQNAVSMRRPDIQTR
jgi:hypothetical protein